MQLQLGPLQPRVDARLKKMAAENFGRRLWAKDPSLWTGDPHAVRARLGWLDVWQTSRPLTPALRSFAEQVRRDGFQHVLLLGMGGSSLCAEALRRTNPQAPGFPELRVLDSTVPAAVRAAEAGLDFSKTLLVVASKSGTTLEVTLNYKTFMNKVGRAEALVAVSDPGSPLEKLAADARFLRFFAGAPDVGGRYSALSAFGLVPAVLMGIDIDRVLDDAALMAEACGPDVPVERNAALMLGAAMAEAALGGRDKLTLLLPREYAALGVWIEQLVAESTGKNGRGIVPVDAEPVPEAYGEDRLFVGPMTGKLSPAVRLAPKSFGADFLLWEIAVAVAGSILGVNPFDEPDVTLSKNLTQTLISKFHRTGQFPTEAPKLEEEGVAIFVEALSLRDALAAHFGRARAGDYLAILAYLHPTQEIDRELQALREALPGSRPLATTVGYGPRYLHSTGQLHKGGPDSGVFLVVTADDPDDPRVGGERYTYGMLSQAQALGDLEALQSRGRRAMRVHLKGDAVRGLRKLRDSLA